MASLIYVDDVVVDENSEFAEFRVWLNQASALPVTVSYATDDWTAIGNDYVRQEGRQGGTLSFQPGETVQTVRVQITNDNYFESPERFMLKLSNPSNAVIEKSIGWATIYDNDALAGMPVVRVDDLVVDEASGEARFVVWLDRPSTGTVSVSYGTRDGSALAGQDYAATSGILTFTPGQTVKTVAVPILNDAVAEGNERFSLLLSDLIGATALGEPAGTAVIWANDAPPQTQPRLYVSDVVLDESQRFADFTVYLEQPGASVVTVSYATDDWTANGYDYERQEGRQSGTLSFQPGETVKTVRIDISNDNNVEGTERFMLKLSNPANAVIEKGTGWATIHDNDAAQGMPQVRIEPAQVVVNESEREAVFAIVLDRPASGVVELDYATLGATAAAGQDFVAAAGRLFFAPGEVVKTVRVALIDDGLSEAAENFSLAIFNLSGATTVAPTRVATIGASDGTRLMQPAISVADVAVTEGQRFLDFQVTLSAPATNAVTVSYVTDDGTANGYDYERQEGRQGGTLSFQPGETVKTVRIDINDDSNVENPEQFTLKLSNPLNAVLDRATATATIYDNDGNKQLPSTAADDTYEISDPSTRPTEAANAGNDTVRSWVSYQLPDEVENLVLLGIGDTDATGNTGANMLTGNVGNNTLRGLWGNDTIDGGGSLDTAMFAGRMQEYAIGYDAGQQRFTIADQVAGRDGTDTLVNVENFVFADGAFVHVAGGAGADVLGGSRGNDFIHGGGGIDEVVFDGARSQYTLARQADGSWVVSSGHEGRDSLYEVERLRFQDQAVALDLQGNTGQAARLVAAVAGAPALQDPGLMGLALQVVDAVGLQGAARLAVDAGLVAQYVGSSSQQALIAHLFMQIVGQAPSAQELQDYVGLAQAQNFGAADVVAFAASLELTSARIDLVGLAEQGLAYL